MASLDEGATIRQNSLLALVWTCFGVACLFVTLRTAVRFRVTDRLSAEDFWMLFALATLLTLCILETIQLPSLYYMTAVLSGTIPVSLDLIAYTEDYLRYQFPITVLFWTVLWSVKAGFLALYFKLFRELPIYRHVWYALAAFTFLAYAGCWISLTVSCGTLSNFFKFNQCGSERDIWLSNLNIYYSTVVDVFTDLCIMAMPLRLIYNVKVSAKQRAGLVCLFGLCFVMIAFAIIRANQVLVPKSFVNLTLLMVWSTLAASISVIVGSLPAFKLFLTNRNTKRSQHGSSGGNRQLPMNNDSKLRGKSVPLNSFSSTKSIPRRYPDASRSTEEILLADGNQFVMAKNEIQSASYTKPERPYPIYQNGRPGSGYGRAF